ncbi:aquaporin AQPAe.a-like [Tachypleus tridentatus]|uniref:aquaporin AQPAe.a-like n=1 Tax=Tachypleus tridentatus TaxID=6853 RepID=UPI003FD557F3
MAARSNLRQMLGSGDIANKRALSVALLAEFLGTAILVLIGCGSCITGWDSHYSPTIVQIALAFGVTVGTVVQFIGHVSGGHINPAVTFAFLVTAKISLLRAVLYVIVQCLGGIVGAGLLKALTPSNLQGNLGATVLSEHLSPVQGFVVELCITLVLVFTVFACCDENRQDIKGSAPLAIGLSVATCHMFAIKYTGSSMNTARSIGPAVVANIWTDYWVYCLGPILGGVIAGLLYDHIFSAPAPTPPSEVTEHLEKVEVH